MPFDWLRSLRRSPSTRRHRPASLTPSTDILEHRTLLSALPVGPETRVNSYTTDFQVDPAVAMDADGDYVVVWESNPQDGSQSGIFAQLYRSGGTPVGSEFRINSYTTDYQTRPAVAMDADGDFVVVWSSNGQDGSSNGIYAQRYSSQGTPLGAFKVSTYTTGSQHSAAVSMDADGDFVVTWSSKDQDGSGYGIYAQRYNAVGTPQGSEFKVNSYTTNNQFGPSIAMDQAGNFAITWFSDGQDGSFYGVYAQRYNAAGTPQGTEFRVNSYTTSDQRYPSIAMDLEGNFAIAWTSIGQDGSSYGVYAQRYNSAGTPQGPEFRVNSYTTSFQSLPSIGMNQQGDFVIAWYSEQQDGNSGGIFAQQYDANGYQIGNEFRVNSYTTSTQYAPAVAIDRDGDFVIAWQSNAQDGSSYGIYHQRYRASQAAYVGSWRTGTFFLDSNQNDNYDGSIDDSQIGFGSTTDKPITGDWNGDGFDDIGVWRAGTFFLDANGNGLWDGSSIDRTFPFGISTDTPVIGDWNRDGKDEVGVWRAGKFYLDLNANRILDAAPTDAVFSFGAATDTPIAGDWNGDGYDDIGTWRAGRFFLDLNGNRKWDRPAVDTVFFFGVSTDKPAIGDWNGDGVDDVGVWRAGQFWVDFNGNRYWDGPENEYIIDFGNTTDNPLVGYWRPKTTPGNPPLPALPPTNSATTPKPASASTPLASLLASPKRKITS